MIETGQRFPDFALPNQDGKTLRNSDFEGKWLVVYVYPKDDTPGCTIQGKSFTATKDDFDAAGVHVLGVSADDVESHRNFCNKYGFTIDLLSDTSGELLQAMGAGQSEFRGTMYWNRTTFVIGPDGIVRKTYANVNPQGHEQVLLDDIRAMQNH
jgi:thioredoxin-dependent peroxiredoxin